MGLSETIMAAMIGAIATVTAALFQLSMAWRARSKVEIKPRRGMTARSILAVLALMTASAAGGFLYSELIRQRSGEEMRAMREELKDLRALIAGSRDQMSDTRTVPDADAARPSSLPAILSTSSDRDTVATVHSVESIVYVPACRRGDAAGPCDEADGQRIALCGTIPSYARVDGIELFAQPDAVQHPWDSHRITFEQDVGGARFTGNSFEYAQADDLKAVCVNFMHWSSEHPHIARVLVRYGFGTPPGVTQPPTAPAAPAAQPEASGAPAIIAIGNRPAVSNSAMAVPVTIQ